MKIVGDDFLDPNNWQEDDYEHRIYASDDLSIYVIVDAVDYPFLAQYRWTLHSRDKYERLGYIQLKRVIEERLGPEGPRYISPLSGKLVRNYKRIQRTRFLYQDVMLRTGIPQPTPKHKEVNHISAKTIDCRRANLEWATRAMQVVGSNKGRRSVNRKPGANVQASRPDRLRRGSRGVRPLSSRHAEDRG